MSAREPSGTTRDEAPDVLEARLWRWLAAEHGLAEPRRLARADADQLLVSKFAPGFAARVGEALDRLALFDASEPLAAACAALALGEPGGSRVELWRAAACDLVHERAAARGLSDEDADLVVAGVDSVAAVMRAVLWRDPVAGEPYAPAESERRAYREALARAETASDLFTRHYGVFEGRAVVAHCPGAPYARTLLATAWRACTGTPTPA